MANQEQVIQNQQAMLQALMQQQQQQQAAAGRLKAKAPDTYSGAYKEVVRVWLFDMDVYFDAQRIMPSDVDKIAYAASLLRRHAKAWWADYRTRLAAGHVEAAGVIDTWERFKASLTARFQPVDTEKTAFDRLRALQQRTSVASYTYDFLNLTTDITNFPDNLKLMQYVSGLKPHIRTQVEISNPTNLNAAIQIAERVDVSSFPKNRGLGRMGMRSHASAPFGSARGHASNGPAPMELGSMQQRGSNGRFQPRRQLTDAERDRLRRQGACFYCRQPGHISINCPNRPKPRFQPIRANAVTVGAEPTSRQQPSAKEKVN